MLEPGYDGRSLFARQVFFPIAGAMDGWSGISGPRSTTAESRHIAAPGLYRSLRENTAEPQSGSWAIEAS